MYQEHFGFNQEPFSIAPDPKFLYLSESHNEALAHLLYGFTHGGFVLVTGEVGTGKTTLLRNLLDKTPAEVDVAFILNPRLTVRELLETLCDELGVSRSGEPESVKGYIDVLNRHLLETHRSGRSTVMIIDEAQNLTPAVLEQIRLLTNLETNEKKLLRIILLGQPELQEILARADLRQLSQRITARYHLNPLSRDETTNYIVHRVTRAGGNPHIFTDRAIRALYRISKGTPRLINIIADRALLGAYVEGGHKVTPTLIRGAAKEVLGSQTKSLPANLWTTVAAVIVLTLGTLGLLQVDWPETEPAEPSQAAPEPVAQTRTVSAGQSQTPPPTTTQTETTASTSPPVDLMQSRERIVRPAQPSYRLQRLAFAEVFAMWGADFDVESNPVPCDFAPKAGLQCLRTNGGWTEINNLDSPVVLELWDDQPAPYYGALTRFNGQLYEIVVGDKTYNVQPKDLRDSWFGAYVILWQTPPDYRGSLREGDDHSSVQWLREKLNLLEPAEDFGTSSYFDARLSEIVRSFQAEHGLIADGVVGPLTWIQLANQLELPAPKLSS